MEIKVKISFLLRQKTSGSLFQEYNQGNRKYEAGNFKSSRNDFITTDLLKQNDSSYGNEPLLLHAESRKFKKLQSCNRE
jgi:hypothetical protein